MEQTIKLSEKEVELKATAKLPLIYMAAFGEDIMQVQGKIFAIVQPDGTLDLSRMSEINCVGVMQIIWSMAKCAEGDKVPAFEEWLEEFETFPIFDVLFDVLDLFFANMQTTTRIKNASAVEA